MATYTITGTVIYSSQANRDAALTRVNTALVGQSYTNVATSLPAGVNTSGTTGLSVSIQIPDDTLAGSTMKLILDAMVAVNRQTSGYIGVNRT